MHALYDAARARKNASASPGSGYSRCARAMHFSIVASLSFAFSVCAPASATKPVTAKPNDSATKRPVLVFTVGLPYEGVSPSVGVEGKQRCHSFFVKRRLCAACPLRRRRRMAATRTGTHLLPLVFVPAFSPWRILARAGLGVPATSGTNVRVLRQTAKSTVFPRLEVGDFSRKRPMLQADAQDVASHIDVTIVSFGTGRRQDAPHLLGAADAERERRVWRSIHTRNTRYGRGPCLPSRQNVGVCVRQIARLKRYRTPAE
jgi:hypothetical protein